MPPTLAFLISQCPDYHNRQHTDFEQSLVSEMGRRVNMGVCGALHVIYNPSSTLHFIGNKADQASSHHLYYAKLSVLPNYFTSY